VFLVAGDYYHVSVSRMFLFGVMGSISFLAFVIFLGIVLF